MKTLAKQKIGFKFKNRQFDQFVDNLPNKRLKFQLIVLNTILQVLYVLEQLQVLIMARRGDTCGHKLMTVLLSGRVVGVQAAFVHRLVARISMMRREMVVVDLVRDLMVQVVQVCRVQVTVLMTMMMVVMVAVAGFGSIDWRVVQVRYRARGEVIVAVVFVFAVTTVQVFVWRLHREAFRRGGFEGSVELEEF